MPAIDDTNLHSPREVNVFLQGQLALLDAIGANTRWLTSPAKEFTEELVIQLRDRIQTEYKERFPGSDLK